MLNEIIKESIRQKPIVFKKPCCLDTEIDVSQTLFLVSRKHKTHNKISQNATETKNKFYVFMYF
jgi:hypothetical protein